MRNTCIGLLIKLKRNFYHTKLLRFDLLQQLGLSFFFFLINLFIYLFIFGCVGSSLLRVGFLWLQ